MMLTQGGQPIQAFPVTPATYVGKPTGISTRGFTILHAAEDGDIEFDFESLGTVNVVVTAGQDIAIDSRCRFITASGTVWMS